MKNGRSVYNTQWHNLNEEGANFLFEIHLGDVTVKPFDLLPELKRLRRAMVDVVWDGYKTTTYLIRETGKEYTLPPVMDDVKREFPVKPLIFIIYEEYGLSIVERVKEPRFKAVYDPKSKDVLKVDWIDLEPNPTLTISNMSKVKWFLEQKVR